MAGLVSALLSIGGIHLFKKIAAFCLPFLLLLVIYGVVSSEVHVSWKGLWSPSFFGVLSTLSLALPGFINLPTLFKHSRSKADSCVALTVIVALLFFLEISTIWIMAGGSRLEGIAIYVGLTLVPSNLLNIYFAAACWESIVPRFGGSKGFAVIGLLGTLIYTFLQISTPVQLFEDLTNSYFVALGVVLLMGCLTRLFIKHRLRSSEKMINMATWLVGCLVATVHEAYHFLEGIPTMVAGMSGAFLFFLVVIFIEESLWAVRKIVREEKVYR